MLVGLHASIENPTSTQTHLILATHNLYGDKYKRKAQTFHCPNFAHKNYKL
jgi:hypothetical protein